MGYETPQLVGYVDVEPEVGDLIIFRNGNEQIDDEWTMHRVVDETQEGYVTKGDANPVVDQREHSVIDYATNQNTAGVILFELPLFKTFFAWCLIMLVVSSLIFRKRIETVRDSVSAYGSSHS